MGKGFFDWAKDDEVRQMLSDLDEKEKADGASPEPVPDSASADQSPVGRYDQQGNYVYDAPPEPAADDGETPYGVRQGYSVPGHYDEMTGEFIPDAEPLPANAGLADETALPLGPDPSLDYDEALDDDYRAVIEDIASTRRREVYMGVAVGPEEEAAYTQFPAHAKSERADSFEVSIDDDSFADLERVEAEGTPMPPPEKPEHPEHPARSPHVRRRRRFRLLKALLLAAIIIGISLYLSNIILNAVYDVFGLQKEDIDIEVDIPEGSSVVQIAEILNENNVISEPLIFRVYSRLKGTDETYQYGTYSMNQKMSYDEIIRMLQERVPRKDVVNITIPEGLTVYEISKLLEENKVCDGSEFLDIVRTADIDHDLVKNIADSKYRYFKLEGYLFPDTYEFYLGESASSVVRRFLDNFQTKYDEQLTLAMYDTDYTLDQILTLASIIQLESSHVENMDMVSSVFHNRLNAPDLFPQLQSDPTISYVTDNILPLLDVRDDGFYAAYSTYLCSGLPVGPICNPGIEAIRAAIYPTASKYYFFVSDREGNFYYAETDAQHEINKDLAGIEE